jgi:glyoxylase-like metal-dependent hydrolase (beta-lactamase superfamily II)
MTAEGTNTYILGEDVVAIVDPGPDHPAHRSRIGAAVGDREVAAILITHSHCDHSEGAARLSDLLQAPVRAFGDSAAGRSPVMERLAREGLGAGGEGVDTGFAPDEPLVDGAVLDLGGEPVQAHWTPGHMGNHLCFSFGRYLLTGDLVMGWASSIVSPPDGDVAQFLNSCERLLARNDRCYFPGHGAPVEEPRDRVRWLIEHRRMRGAQIEAALSEAPATCAELTTRLYFDVSRSLHFAARRNVFAHLIDLHEKGWVGADPELSPEARFFRRD